MQQITKITVNENNDMKYYTSGMIDKKKKKNEEYQESVDNEPKIEYITE